jgi:hypothetical protein
MSTMFRWNIEVKKIEWQYVLADMEENLNIKRKENDIVKIASRIKNTVDEGHIVYCSRANGNATDDKRTLVGYLVEQKYSAGGSSPKL